MSALDDYRHQRHLENRSYHRSRLEQLAEVLNSRVEIVEMMQQEMRSDGGFAASIAELQLARVAIAEAHLRVERALERLSRLDR